MKWLDEAEIMLQNRKYEPSHTWYKLGNKYYDSITIITKLCEENRRLKAMLKSYESRSHTGVYTIKSND